MRSSGEFRLCVRRGARVGRSTLVIHALRTQSPPSRAGFVVSKAVGNAVTRNRVKRQLRHLVAEALPRFGFPVDIVVRALPPAASQDFRGDFVDALAAVLAKAEAA